MIITISLFAGLADRIGTSKLNYQCPESNLTVERLKQRLSEEYPAAASLIAVSFVAVNQEYALGDRPVTAEDEIALIPPVSGGDSTRDFIEQVSDDGMYAITEAELSIDAVTQKVITANHGATLTFTGTTREMTGDLRTVQLEYEAYIPMALAKLRQIGDEINEQWPGTRCAISHRIGQVGIAGISVVIAVSSPHRDSCYEASRYAIERLKQIVPIWKKEQWDNGSMWKGHGLGPWDPTAPGTLS